MDDLNIMHQFWSCVQSGLKVPWSKSEQRKVVEEGLKHLREGVHPAEIFLYDMALGIALVAHTRRAVGFSKWEHLKIDLQTINFEARLIFPLGQSFATYCANKLKHAPNDFLLRHASLLGGGMQQAILDTATPIQYQCSYILMIGKLITLGRNEYRGLIDDLLNTPNIHDHALCNAQNVQRMIGLR